MKQPGGVRACLVLAATAVCLGANAQRHRLEFIHPDTLPARWFRPVDLASPKLVPGALSAQLAFLHGKGYLEATVDSCTVFDGRTLCPVVCGRPYRWARLSGAGIPKEIASEARFREKLYGGRPVLPAQVGRLLEDLLRYSENNGHPFARAWLDSLRLEGDGLRATVHLDQGVLIRIDSVLVRGDARTDPRLLHTHIGIKPGDLYNESLLRNVERRIRELPYLTQRQRPHVQFTTGPTKLFLFLDAKKASSINGILGVQPDPVTGKVKLTGDLDLRLRNALRRSEAIALSWRSLADRTQDLRIGLNLPYLFNTPFGADGNLRLFKRDTTFLELNVRGTIEFLMTRGDKAGLFVNSKTSDRLGSNTVSVPGLADVKLLSYGLSVERERYDNRFNPRSGHALRAEGSVGRKRTSTAVTGAEPVPEKTTVQYETAGNAALHLPVGRKSTVRLAAQGGWMINDDLYANELYRIGGLRTMRGTDEASIYCSSYAIGTVEYRFLFEENGNFFAFVDQGWWDDATRPDGPNDNPLGFGAGATFETKAGLFSITYALARQFGEPMALRGGKVHFGFISLF